MEKKKNIKVVLGIIILASILIVAVSYALLQTTLSGKEHILMTVGDIDVTLSDDSTNVIAIENGVPVTDAEGKQSSPYKFTIHNNGTRTVKVDIYLEDDQEQLASCNQTNGTCNLLNYSNIKYQLIAGGSSATNILPANRNIGTLTLTGSSNKAYDLRIWLDYATDNTAKGKYFFGKIVLDVTEIS